MKAIKTIWLILSAIISLGQQPYTMVVPDTKGQYESFFYLADTVIASEIASFNVVGDIYGRKPSEPLTVFMPDTKSNERVSFVHDNNSVTIRTGQFQAVGHRLEYYMRSGYLHKIDGRYFWGIDGKIPRRMITDITVELGGQRVAFPPGAFADIYEPNLCFRSSLFGRIECYSAVYTSHDGQRVYIYMRNGRIPSLYEVTWIFSNGRYLGRVVDFAY